MAEQTFYCEVRERTGTGGARQTRRDGWVPGILYGGGKDPVAIRLRKNEVIKALNTGSLTSTLINIDVPGQSDLQKVIPRDVQLDPVKDQPLHVDMLRVDERTRINVDVSVRFLNEETSPGIKKGGVLNIVRHTVELIAPATAIPEVLEFDISETDVGDTVTISMTTLPKGVAPVISDRDFTVATITAPSALRSSESEADDDAQAGEGDSQEAAGDDESAE
ncbi:MAG: 50S ribosomal protein L25/general stress protein Ctc [Pseudomonadota bacterium]